MMKKNSKFAYLVFHPDYLVDLLRAGGRFCIEQSFSIPPRNTPQTELSNFIEKGFPSLSEERYEIWLKFRLPEDLSTIWFSLEDIVGAHFYNSFREEATSDGVLHTLNVYGIPVLEPLEKCIDHVIEEFNSKIRQHTASLIVRAWFNDIKISEEFIDQLRLGYKYQQSPAPQKLPPIPSNLIWAHMVAYNHGLRKFDERPDVLWLQDVQEVIKRTDANFKQQLKLIGSEFNSKFSDILDDAEQSKQNGITPSKWIISAKKNSNPYFHEMDKFLSKLGKQHSFFYSALLYLNWRESVLNNDYSGKLSDHKEVGYFLSSTADNPMRRAIAEALFAITYAGGPRVFQQAMIEARMKILGIHGFNGLGAPQQHDDSIREDSKPLVERLFAVLKKSLGDVFGKKYEEFDKGKKKDIREKIKIIEGNITKVKKGEFSYDQYVKLCSLFDIPVEIFDDYPIGGENSSSTIENLNEVEQNSSSDPVLPADMKDDLSSAEERNIADSDLADIKEGSASDPIPPEINHNQLLATEGQTIDTDHPEIKEDPESNPLLEDDTIYLSEKYLQGLNRAENEANSVEAPTESDDMKENPTTDTEENVSHVVTNDDFPAVQEIQGEMNGSEMDGRPADTDQGGIKEDPGSNPMLEDETINQSEEHSEGSVRAEKEEDSTGIPTVPDGTRGNLTPDIEEHVVHSDQVDKNDDSPSAPVAPVDRNISETEGTINDTTQSDMEVDMVGDPMAPADENDDPSRDIQVHVDLKQKTGLEEVSLEKKPKEDEILNSNKSTRTKRRNHGNKKSGISKINQGDLFGDSE